MRWLRWITRIAIGILSGLVATLLLVLILIAARTWLGISPPPEALPDRFAPTLDIQTFFSLFGRFGGYNGLKKFGVTSVLSGMVVVGVLVGVIYALVAGRGRPGEADRGAGAPSSRRGLGFVAGVVAVLWLGTVVVLWPVLGANYRGLPPSSARIVSIVGLLVAYAAYGVALAVVFRWIVGRSGPLPNPSPDSEGGAHDALSALPRWSSGSHALGSGRGREPLPRGRAGCLRAAVGEGAATGAVGEMPPSSWQVGRRAVVAGAAGAALAVPSYLLMRRLYERATFTYDGRPTAVPGCSRSRRTTSSTR